MKSVSILAFIAAIVLVIAGGAVAENFVNMGQPGQFYAPASPGAGPAVGPGATVQPSTVVPQTRTYIYPFAAPGDPCALVTCQTCPVVQTCNPCAVVRPANPCNICGF